MTDGGLDELRAARQELEAAIADIRAVPGYAEFLAPADFADVAGAADEHPLVYLAAAEPGGLALVVRGGEVTHVPLPELTDAVLRERVQRHFAVYHGYRAAPGAARGRWYASLDDVTAWLWDTVAAPVLAELGDATHVAVVAGGLLGLLPLHAAWTPDADAPTGRRYLLDTIAVSYAPNARSLTAARRLATRVAPRRLLAVADPWPVAGGRLPMAVPEAAVAAAAFPDAAVTLTGGEATFLAVEWQAPHADVLHLACHGVARLDHPLDSGLLLAGGRVTLRRLLDLRLRVRLAVLSACETALPGTELPDEVVALPSGLLQAGVAGVVASQWAVPDRATAMLMAEFYRGWRWRGRAPLDALRAAQTWVRDTTNGDKSDHFQAAAEGPDAWLSEAVAERFRAAAAALPPDRRGEADLHHWAAFTYVGA